MNVEQFYYFHYLFGFDLLICAGFDKSLCVSGFDAGHGYDFCGLQLEGQKMFIGYQVHWLLPLTRPL